MKPKLRNLILSNTGSLVGTLLQELKEKNYLQVPKGMVVSLTKERQGQGRVTDNVPLPSCANSCPWGHLAGCLGINV